MSHQIYLSVTACTINLDFSVHQVRGSLFSLLKRFRNQTLSVLLFPKSDVTTCSCHATIDYSQLLLSMVGHRIERCILLVESVELHISIFFSLQSSLSSFQTIFCILQIVFRSLPKTVLRIIE